MTALSDLKLLVLSGKGGVGKTTVAAALARAAAGVGKRVLIAQTESAERLGPMFGRPGPIGPDVISLAAGIDGVNMTPKSALHQYGLMVLKYETVYRALFENRAERAAGRARYDLVILDGPASGHAILMLGVPQAIVDTMPNGPLTRDARSIRELLSDPARAALAIVTLPEDLPARETAELALAARETLRIPLGPVVVNALPSDELGAPEVDAVLGRLRLGTGDAALDATLRMATSLRAHRKTADEVIARLLHDPGLPLVSLPRLPTADLGPPEIDRLALALAASDAGAASGRIIGGG